jgi:hypothetical protein
MNEIFVFLGPSLAESSARAELDAVYLPPVSEGDVYRLWRRRPRAIGIVDGYFQHVPAVWHKEIMWVMERGVHVFGAAGLGALRAAELDAFGMRGVGRVYQAFRDGTLDRDDEVAVGHGSAEDEYRARSEAMVNIRKTLQAAHDQGIISAATQQALIRAGTALFYQERTWPALLATAEAASTAAAAGTAAAELSALREWLPIGRIDQQAADTVAMLREMRCFLAPDPEPQRVTWSMANTARWEAVRHRIDTMPGAGAAGSQPLLEGILDEIRLLGPGAFEAARCRSLLRVFAADFAGREGVMVDSEQGQGAVAEFRARSGLEEGTDLARFLAANDLSVGDLERLIRTDEMVRWACGQAERDALDDLLDDLRLNGDYSRLVARAREKLADRDGQPGTARSETDAIGWYFTERLGLTVPADLASYARSAGFRDEQAFRQAVRHERRYAGASAGRGRE